MIKKKWLGGTLRHQPNFYVTACQTAVHTIILVDESPLFHFNLRQPILPQFVGNEFICLNTLNITDAYIKVWQRVNPLNEKKGRFLSLIKGEEDIEKKSPDNLYQCIDSRDFSIRIKVQIRVYIARKLPVE